MVENPGVAVRESLPKRRKLAEKGRESQCRRLEISTQMEDISHMGRESPIRMSQISTQTAGNWEKGRDSR